MYDIFSPYSVYVIKPIMDDEEWSKKIEDVYYGMSKDPVSRMYQHRSKHNRCYSKLLVDKYGKDNIEMIIIGKCRSREDCYILESKYLRKPCINYKQ